MISSRTVLAGLSLCLLATVGRAADAPKPDDAKAQYERERARCMSGTTGQDRASCLKSAGAAYDALKGNRLQDPNSNYRDNALVRCRSLPEADRGDCESRVDGKGTSSGSVKEGGVVTETVTRDIKPAPK